MKMKFKQKKSNKKKHYVELIKLQTNSIEFDKICTVTPAQRY